MKRNLVRPHDTKLTDADARHYLAAGLIRTCHEYGPSRVALESGCDEKTIRRARDEESTLGLACTFNLLDIDPHALDHLAAAKGFCLVPLNVELGTDMEIIAELSGLLAEWTDAMRDGVRDTPETKKIATKVRRLLPKLFGIKEQDDQTFLKAVA